MSFISLQLLTALIPKMVAHNVNGRFITIKQSRPDRTNRNVSSTDPYTELVDQLRGQNQTHNSINLATIYCDQSTPTSDPRMSELAHHIVAAIESGNNQIEIRKSYFVTHLIK